MKQSLVAHTAMPIQTPTWLNMNYILPTGNNAWLVYHANGTRTFVPPLTLRPLPPSRPFQTYPQHGYVRSTNVQGHSLTAFSWNNINDVKTFRFPPNTSLPLQIINSPPDQGNCGSCWIVSAVSMTSDRLAIAALTEPKKLDILDLCCSNEQNGCDGGDSAQAFHLMENQGLRLDSFNSYNRWCHAGYHCKYEELSASNKPSPPPECSCSDTATLQNNGLIANVDANSFVTFYVDDPSKRIAAIQDEIFQNGPVVVGFMATDALIGKYNCASKNNTPFDGSGNPLGGHAVVIVGWGKTVDSQGYWVVRNSWGPTWNGDGYWNYLWNCGMEDSSLSPVTAWNAHYVKTLTRTHLQTRHNRFHTIKTWVILVMALILLALSMLFLRSKTYKQ
jgi:hypothetical protein